MKQCQERGYKNWLCTIILYGRGRARDKTVQHSSSHLTWTSVKSHNDGRSSSSSTSTEMAPEPIKASLQAGMEGQRG